MVLPSGRSIESGVFPKEVRESKVETPRLADIGSYFAFADYMQWSWAYAICLAPDQLGKILQFGTKFPRIVADSFSQFVDAYLTDSEQLYLPTDQMRRRLES